MTCSHAVRRGWPTAAILVCFGFPAVAQGIEHLVHLARTVLAVTVLNEPVAFAMVGFLCQEHLTVSRVDSIGTVTRTP
jgi:hypothetical protein